MGIIRNTKSVKILLDEFNNDDAISVIELIRRLDTKLNKTTIYRVLDKLEDDGILHSFLGNKGTKWYAKCNGCSLSAHADVHPHFQCLNCGRMDCLPESIVIPKISNREIMHSHVLIQGTCELCL
tara:strand:+ start:22841 stop:23215 length:375 start_codon:yes stop_codon:yes gene_type:complete